MANRRVDWRRRVAKYSVVGAQHPYRPKRDRCRVWTGCTVRGYAVLQVDGRLRRVSRLVLGLTDPKVHALHSCDNTLCVRRGHLRRGTDAANRRDKLRRGRQGKGSALGQAKLTEAKARVILRSKEPARVLALRFGVTVGAVYHVRRGLTWKHVQGATPCPKRRRLPKQRNQQPVRSPQRQRAA